MRARFPGSVRVLALSLLALAACGTPSDPASAADTTQVARLDVPLQSIDASGRSFRLTGTLALSGPEDLSVVIGLDDATAAQDVLTLMPVVGTYEVTLGDYRIYELDAITGSYFERPDVVPATPLVHVVQVLRDHVATARFAFAVAPPTQCLTNNGGCDPSATCGYSAGSVTCECPAQWLDVHGDGSLCQRAHKVAVGTLNACAIAGDGALYCWGQNQSGQLGDGTRADSSRPVRVGSQAGWTDVSLSGAGACGIRAGELYCWGSPSLTGISGPVPLRVGTASDWFHIAMFASTSCGLRGAGEVYCWGNNASGQLGIGSTLPSTIGTPTRAGTLDGVIDLGIGNGGQVCAVRSNGELHCWGENGSGLLGDGTTTDRYSPTLISNAGWTAVAGGQGNTCGIASGVMYCWGISGYGVLGNGSNAGPAVLAPQAVGNTSGWTDVAFGHYHVCGIRSGELYCWGGDAQGQLGNGPGVLYTSTPTRVGTSAAWTDVDANLQASCGVDEGEVYCWGENTYGQLGTGVGPNAVRPKLISTDSSWSDLSAGGGYTCGIREGALYCWGEGGSGKLGLGSTGSSNFPTVVRPARVGTATDWTRVRAGLSHTCGIRSGELHCWGSNGSGRLGDGTATSRAVPAPVLTPLGASANGWTEVITGNDHTCAINQGALYCWGANGYGQRGDALTGTPATTPLLVGFDSDWHGLAGVEQSTCALRGRDLYCWGYNVTATQSTLAPTLIAGSWDSVAPGYNNTCGLQSGELYCWGGPYLGNGTTGSSTTPLRIGTDGDWLSLTHGFGHVCGVRVAGTYCFGSNSAGQLGDGSQTLRSAPVLTSAATDWSLLDAGRGHTCGVRPGEGLFCWGQDDLSQFGDGYESSAHVPQLSLLP